MTDKLGNLFKTDDGDKRISATTPKELQNSKEKINEICSSLNISTQKYSPEKTVTLLHEYIASSDKMERILYSEISNHIFSLGAHRRGIFASNAERLLYFAYSAESNCTSDCRKIIIKIYDHSQLALHQIENATNILASGIENTKENIKSELQENIKGIEKEYITILGIFASIVLAFVGGITFSTSVLQSIGEVSVFRLLIVIDFLGFILLNVVYLLMKFIFVINGHDVEIFKIKTTNTILAVIGVLVIVAWFILKY